VATMVSQIEPTTGTKSAFLTPCDLMTNMAGWLKPMRDMHAFIALSQQPPSNSYNCILVSNRKSDRNLLFDENWRKVIFLNCTESTMGLINE
jgi:hypothetical protein